MITIMAIHLESGLRGLRRDGEKIANLVGDLPHLFVNLKPRDTSVETSVNNRFEIPTVSEELYAKTREELAKKGFTFVAAIMPVSIFQLGINDGATTTGLLFEPGLEEVCRKSISDTSIIVPPWMKLAPPMLEVAINPNNLRVRNSNYRPESNRKRTTIQEVEAALKAKLPQEVKDVIGMPVLSASALAQLDIAYQKEKGKVIFDDWVGRTCDKEWDSDRYVNVGRYSYGDPSGCYDGLLIIDERFFGYYITSEVAYLVPAVVLPRKASS